MATSSATGKSRAGRAFVRIVVLAAILAAILSGVWYVLAQRLDRLVTEALSAAELEGTRIECPNRETFGYPFRIGIRCTAVTLDDARGGTRLSAGELRTAAQIYRPNHVVAELDGPMRLETPALPPLDLRWSLAQASGTFWSEGLDHFAIVMDEPRIAQAGEAGAGTPLAEATRGEAYARRRGEDLDIAFTDLGLRLLAGPAASLPPADLGGDLTIEGAADWLSGGAQGQSARALFAGRRTEIRSLKVDFAGSGAELSGSFSANDAGEVSGQFDLAVADPARVASFVGGVAPDLAGIANSVAGAISFLGREDNGRRVIPLTVRDGDVSAGFLPLGRLPRFE